jgi:hypothetical protein
MPSLEKAPYSFYPRISEDLKKMTEANALAAPTPLLSREKGDGCVTESPAGFELVQLGSSKSSAPPAAE